MSNKIIFPFIYVILLHSYLSFGQKKEDNGFYKKFGFEIGAGYNTTTSKYSNVGYPGFTYNLTENQNLFWVQPTVKMFYSFTLHNFSDSSYKKISMPIFIGYYTFGGAIKGNGFRTDDFPSTIVSPEKIITFFRSIETGINPCYEKNKIQFGLLFKVQYILSARIRTFHDPWDNGAMIEDGIMIQERDISTDYKKFAMNTGIKLKYTIKKFSIGTEAWFGITNLYAHKNYGNNGKLGVFENNYRLLLGFEF